MYPINFENIAAYGTKCVQRFEARGKFVKQKSAKYHKNKKYFKYNNPLFIPSLNICKSTVC